MPAKGICLGFLRCYMMPFPASYLYFWLQLWNQLKSPVVIFSTKYSCCQTHAFQEALWGHVYVSIFLCLLTSGEPTATRFSVSIPKSASSLAAHSVQFQAVLQFFSHVWWAHNLHSVWLCVSSSCSDAAGQIIDVCVSILEIFHPVPRGMRPCRHLHRHQQNWLTDLQWNFSPTQEI